MAKLNRPTQFVCQKLRKGFARENHADGISHEFHAITSVGEFIAESKVIRVHVAQSFKSANFGQVLLGGSHGPTKREIQMAEAPSKNGSGSGIRGNPECV